MIINKPGKYPSSQRYDQKFDDIANFWQRIQGLLTDDLVKELVQNELDENSSHTIISFQADKLTCRGKGNPVSLDGWTRLSFIEGAGHAAPRKRESIGVKNHGLKVCFSIGDDIYVKSDGKFINQTLYKDGYNNPPSPGADHVPIMDESAPPNGCLIEVPYRLKTLIVTEGEPFKLDPVSDKLIENIFLKACHETPQWFIGALRPGIRQNYIIELVHHSLGTARFEFKCGRERTFGKLRVYNRVCRVSGNISELPDNIKESCYLSMLNYPDDSNREIPKYYSAHKGFFLIEVSWNLDDRGKPLTTIGHRRYPISYGNDASSLTGVGFHYSGPYISDRERQRPTDAPFNTAIDEACTCMLVDVLKYKLIPQYGARAMNLLIPTNGDVNKEHLCNLVERMLDAGAFPLSKANAGVELKKLGSKKIIMGPRREPGGNTRRLVIPAFTWEINRVSVLLAKLCPVSEDQIDPNVPKPILTILSSADGCKGWEENHIRFDEFDIIERLQPNQHISFFPWADENGWKRALGNPDLMNLYLDVIKETYNHLSPTHEQKFKQLLNNILLPDTKRLPTQLGKLYTGNTVPTNLPVKNIPQIIHPDLSGHTIFKETDWKRQTFKFNQFLDLAEFEKADEITRKSFWEWIRTNWKKVPRKPTNQWVRIASLPIWPDLKGDLMPLSDFCMPSRGVIGKSLKNELHMPNQQVLKIGPVKEAKRGSLHIRTLPSKLELENFLKKRISIFNRQDRLTSDEKEHYHAFETELSELASLKELRTYFKDLSEYALALDGCGFLRPITELVTMNEETKSLCLLEEDKIDRKNCIFDRIDGWRPKEFPTTTQILKTLKQDSQNINAHIIRLGAYLKAAENEHVLQAKKDIINIQCIPVDNKLFAPGELAFKSNHGDYWGGWKYRISGSGLSADVEKIYHLVGVTRGEPNPETSLSFFQWLNSQNQAVVANHLACIIRHINHHNGPSMWSLENPNCGFIPIGTGNGINLVSKKVATSQQSWVFIPDFEPLKIAIQQNRNGRGPQLVELRHPEVNRPITDYLRSIGIKSLRASTGDPIKAEGHFSGPVPKNIINELENLRTSRMAKELRKRLDDIGISTDMFKLKERWQDRLNQIQNVRLASSIIATFQIGRWYYQIAVEAAFDGQTGTIWLLDSVKHIEDLFYQNIAERIFENPRDFMQSALRQALHVEFKEDYTYGKPQGSEGDDENGDGKDDGKGEVEREAEDGGLGDTNQTHQGKTANPKDNLPNPSNIPNRSRGGNRRRKQDANSSGGHSGRVSSDLEDTQKDDLKRNQYAWHCQFCLAEHSPEELAPDKSYAEIKENRAGMIEAHHPDQVNAGGARHAGNMLIECSYHHSELGDKISRDDVSTGLLVSAEDHNVVFKAITNGKPNQRNVPGKLVTIKVPSTNKFVKCFFTDWHAQYWIQKLGV